MKKGFITYSKLMIDKLGRSLTRSENVYFANNEQASIAVLTAAFFFFFCTFQTLFNKT